MKKRQIKMSGRAKIPAPRRRNSHIFAKDEFGHYVEPTWCDRRLFDAESFDPTVLDPFCGWMQIPQAAVAVGYRAVGSDIVDRGAANKVPGIKFYRSDFLYDPPVIQLPFSIVSNPPFNLLRKAVERALALGVHKIAFIWRVQRLGPARWMRDMPLARIYLLNPRPSMPTGTHIEAGGHVGGDRQEYCWLIFERGHIGKPEIHWLVRDEERDDSQTRRAAA